MFCQGLSRESIIELVKRLLVLLFLIGLYLNRSYAYFYHFLSQHHLDAPTHETKTLVGNNNGKQTIRYVALGDSLTEGVGTSDYQNSYPSLLAQRLSAQTNVELINLSRAGDTSTDVATNQLPQALAVKPEIVTVLIGINDIHNLKSLAEFKANYTQIVAALKKNGARVYTLSIPYLGSGKIVYFPYNFLLNLRTKQFNSVIKKISTDLRVSYIDLYSLEKSANFYATDEFHPTDYGYQQWAKAINVN